jgi:hypothetical protein
MKTNTFTFVVVFLFLINSAAFSLWKPAALSGTNVTALVYKSDLLFVGTEKAGIYRYENHTASRIGSDSLMGSTVRCIEVFKKGDIIIAGTDKGLFSFSIKSGSRWTKNDQVEPASVQALLRYHDSLFFVVTDKKVYVSTIKADSLAADLNFEVLNVSSALPPGIKDLELRCISMFRDTLFIGSIFTESNSSWGGILRSIDNGKTWSGFNNGWTGVALPGIQSLAVFQEQFNSKQPTFLANAIVDISKEESAVFRKKGSDATWERVAGLNNRCVNQVYVTFFSNSKVALEHVAADSGVYKNSNGVWNKIDNLTGVNIVIGNDDGSTGVGYTILFAGTTTGLHENLESVIIKKNTTSPTKSVQKTPHHSLIIQPKKVKSSAAGWRIISDRNSNAPVSPQGKFIR